MENSYNNTVLKNKKENSKYHGFGIKIIKQIVKKYSDTYETQKLNTSYITLVELKNSNPNI